MGLSPFHVVDCVTRCSRRPKSMCLSAVRGAWVQLSEWSNLRGYVLFLAIWTGPFVGRRFVVPEHALIWTQSDKLGICLFLALEISASAHFPTGAMIPISQKVDVPL